MDLHPTWLLAYSSTFPRLRAGKRSFGKEVCRCGDWRDRIAGRIFALYMAALGSIRDTPYGTLSPSGVIPEQSQELSGKKKKECLDVRCEFRAIQTTLSPATKNKQLTGSQEFWIIKTTASGPEQ